MFAKANIVEDKLALKMYEHKLDHKRKSKFREFRPNGSSPTFKKKGYCFMCRKLGHHAPQCMHKARNNNSLRANITERDDIIVVVVS